MEQIVPFIKYGFVLALMVEVALILRALFNVAREKARAAAVAAPAAPDEE